MNNMSSMCLIFTACSKLFCHLARQTKKKHLFLLGKALCRRRPSQFQWCPRSGPLFSHLYSLLFSLSLLLPSPILSVRPPLTAGELGRPARLPERPAAVVLGVRLLPHGDDVDRRVRRHCLRDLARQGLPSHVPPRRTRKYHSRKMILSLRPRGCG